jgi:tetratricopeptide (TPR) repeat protein
LYTPQRLFGDVEPASDIFTHGPFLERARLQREQADDAAARLALGAYVMARLVDKLLSFASNDGDGEAFRWQLEAVRRHVSDLPANAPETAHLAGVVAAISPEGFPSQALWKSLTAYSYFLENEGRLEEALEMLALAARTQGRQLTLPEFVQYGLAAGRLNRELARWDAAVTCYDATEQAALQVGDLLAICRGRLGRGGVHRGQGNFPLARVAAEAVVRWATELNFLEGQALAYADLGVIYSLQGQKLEALDSHYRAFRLSTDPQQQMRTLSDLAMELCGIGAFEAARLAFQIVIQSPSKLLVRVNAIVELMDLESTAGNRVAFERCRARAEEHRSRMSPSMTVDYHYKLGCGFARFGQQGRARTALTQALATAERHRLNAWYFRVEQALANLAESQTELSVREGSELSAAPAVREMELGLREYALESANA